MLDITLIKKLKLARRNRGITIRKVSQLSGISASHISRIEKGERMPSVSVINKLCDVYGLEIGELLASESALKEREITNTYSAVAVKIPLYSLFGSDDFFGNENIKDFIPTALGFLEKNAFAITVPDNSMSGAKLFKNEILFLNKQDYVSDGEIALIKINNETPVLRRVYKNGKYFTLLPQSDGESSPIMIDKNKYSVTILGKAVKSLISI